MLVYILILIVLGGGVIGWLGFQSRHESENLKARIHSRNSWLKRHAIAKQTDENVQDLNCETDDEN